MFRAFPPNKNSSQGKCIISSTYNPRLSRRRSHKVWNIGASSPADMSQWSSDISVMAKIIVNIDDSSARYTQQLRSSVIQARIHCVMSRIISSLDGGTRGAILRGTSDLQIGSTIKPFSTIFFGPITKALGFYFNGVPSLVRGRCRPHEPSGRQSVIYFDSCDKPFQVNGTSESTPF